VQPKLKDAFFAVKPDTPTKPTGFAFAHEYLEVVPTSS
jgi:hypothetical protein